MPGSVGWNQQWLGVAGHVSKTYINLPVVLVFIKLPLKPKYR